MPQEEPQSDGGGQNHGETDDFQNPLPGGDQVCLLGPARDWPETLKAFSLTIASFAYPAAVYWQDELALFHNQAWAELVGVEEQGQKQRGKLSADAWESLSAALYGGKPKRVEARQLLGIDAPAESVPNAYRPVLLSPLFDTEGDGVVGLLAQLIPHETRKPSPTDGAEDLKSVGSAKSRNKDETTMMHHLDISELGNVVDAFPLDEHPFFHRFAEMLPSGLAILDHRAQAVFVNQLFYQLTTHHKENKAFQSWPQSIREFDIFTLTRVAEQQEADFDFLQILRTTTA